MNRNTGLGVLGAILVVDAVLVSAVMWPSSRPANRAQDAAVQSSPDTLDPAAAAAGETPTSTPTPGVAALPEMPAAANPIPRANITAIGTAGQVVFAGTGACQSQSAGVVASTDGGATWTPWAFPHYSVGSLVINDNGSVDAVGINDLCNETIRYQSPNVGGAWQLGNSTQPAWSLVPTTAGEIAGPQGPTPNPCDVVVDLTTESTDSAAVLCQNGEVHTSRDGGQTWQQVASVPQGRALAGQPGGQLYALQTRTDCQGTGLATSTDGGANWSGGTCIAGFDASGPVGLADRGATVMAVAATSRAYVSADNGKAFQPVGPG